MPQPFQPHHVKLEAYLLPVVVEVIDRIPTPRALADIPAPFQGRLLVTLAHELAMLMKRLLLDGRKMRELGRREAARVRRCGDRRYDEALERVRAATERERRQFQEFVRLERAADVRGVPTTTVRGSFREESGEADKFFGEIRTKERKGAVLSAEVIAQYERPYLEVARRYKRVLALRYEAERKLDEERQRVMVGARFLADQENADWSEMLFDFDGATEFQLEGAAFYLRNLDGAWWREFTQAATSVVTRDTLRAPHRIALRDPRTVRSIEVLCNDATGWDVAAERSFRQDDNQWGQVPVGAEVIKRMRQLLRVEDRKAEAWLVRNGGPAHPFNVYRIWRGERDGMGASVSSASDSVERSLNELSWCLVRGYETQVEFRPLTHAGYEEADWERDRVEWWAKIVRAQRAVRRK